MTDHIREILVSWSAGRNALLYGPPATGKTRLVSQLFDALRNVAESDSGLVASGDPALPLARPRRRIPIPTPVKVVWTTFHQSYGYEDFVLGLRAETSSEGTRLQPWAGVLLDAALELADPETEYGSVVIFIDEINRGNAARIFGEFMTFLDFDYREGGSVPLPLPLRQLAYEDGVSEKVLRPGGKGARIREGFAFPRDVYIVATMNSVDRAAVPIDSALARRFDRIEMRPDLDVLADHWSLEKDKIPVATEGNWEDLDPFEAGYLLLDRLNVAIAAELGPEFELGHGLLTPVLASMTDDFGHSRRVPEDEAWRSLAKTWDDVVFPQLEDRFSGRPEQLLDLLRVDMTPPSGAYGFRLRSNNAGTIEARALASGRVSDSGLDIIKRTFRWLTR